MTVQKLDNWSLLALLLTLERRRGAASPWHAYLTTLPRSFDLLLHWSAAEREALRGCSALTYVGDDLIAAQFEKTKQVAAAFFKIEKPVK